MVYSKLLFPPFLRKRCSVLINPAFSKSATARWMVLRERFSSSAMVLMAGYTDPFYLPALLNTYTTKSRGVVIPLSRPNRNTSHTSPLSLSEAVVWFLGQPAGSASVHAPDLRLKSPLFLTVHQSLPPRPHKIVSG